jgi:hypothetical protein
MAGKVYVIKISLVRSRPPIWRRFRVPGETTLDRLHNIIQIVMGWEDCHLHSFTIAGECYTKAYEDAEYDERDEADFSLAALISKPKTKFSYEYDFGDGWEHALVVEKISEVATEFDARLECLAGKRKCPPEDVGGVHGYCVFCEAKNDPKHPEHDNWSEWYPDEFDPEAFDLDGINQDLALYEEWSRPGRDPVDGGILPFSEE